jgi:CRP-like cAMP-binding protein
MQNRQAMSGAAVSGSGRDQQGKGGTPDRRSRVLAALQGCSLFGRWPEHCINALASHGRLERYEGGAQVLAHEPQRREIFIVVAGCIEVSHSSDDGKKFVLGLVGPGEPIALVRLLPQAPMHYGYYAHGSTELVHLPSDALRAVLDSEPILWRDIALLTLGRFAWNTWLLRDQMLASQARRVAAALLSLARLQGVQSEDGSSLRLSQDELGALLGVTRQSVHKELRALEAAGLVRVDYNRISLLDTTALQQLAGGPDFNPNAL